MDHAGDVARALAGSYVDSHPRAGASETDPNGSRRHTSFIVFTEDAGVFRVTVTDVGYAGLSAEELHDRKRLQTNAAERARTASEEDTEPRWPYSPWSER